MVSESIRQASRFTIDQSGVKSPDILALVLWPTKAYRSHTSRYTWGPPASKGAATAGGAPNPGGIFSKGDH